VGWTNTIPFPFIIVDPATGLPILIIDSTGLHLDGTTGHIDMQVSAGQPTIFFANPARTVRAYINAPGGASVAIGSPDYASALPGNPNIHNIAWVSAGQTELGEVLQGTGDFVGGYVQTTDLFSELVMKDVSGNLVNHVQASTSGVITTDGSVGFGFSNTSGYLHRVIAGVFQGWNSLTPLYQNGWGNLGGNWETGSYKVTADGFVQFEGVIIGGTKADGTVLWTMPAAVRPSNDKIMNCTIISAGSAANVSLRVFSATGQVQCFGINATVNGNMSLESSRYSLL
jgi:hypothetical protein